MTKKYNTSTICVWEVSISMDGQGGLFERAAYQPLAERLRPQTLEEFVGQYFPLAAISTLLSGTWWILAGRTNRFATSAGLFPALFPMCVA